MATQPVPGLERTGRRIVAGTWGCAAITMAGSAASAAVAYDYLGEHWGLGLATGVAVDIALCVALVGDRQLYLHGLSSHWGRVLRVTTALMSLVLNSGVAFAQGRYFLAFLHAFLPVLLIVLTEYGQDVLLQFSALTRKQDAAQQPAMTQTPVSTPLPQLHQSAPPQWSRPPAPRAVEPQSTSPKPAPPWTPVPPPEPRTSMPHRPKSQHRSHVVVPIAKPARHTPVSKPKTAGPDPTVVTQVRALIGDVEAAGGQIGRREIAKRLGVTDWIARQALEQVRGDNKPTTGSPGVKGRKASGGTQ